MQQHNKGGVVRVAVSTPPEYADSGSGGNTLRSMTNPRLFDAQPNGTWRASLVEPGTDHTSKNGRTARFKLRNATWSDGTPITVDDLRRTADSQFVDRVDETNGTITVHFKQKLPGWRRLWSDDGIAPRMDGISGGPYVVSSVVSGAETVLKRNDRWWGSAFLDEVHLQYVPDPITARQLLQKHDVDVVVPEADTVRTQHFEMDGVKTDVQKAGGVWTALQINSANWTQQNRVAIAAAFPRDDFVKSLLGNEASIDPSWTQPSSTNNVSGTMVLTTPVENPLTTLLDTAFTRALTANGASVSSRAVDQATVDRLIAAKTYDVAFVTHHDGPSKCWQCDFGEVDSSLATKADAGDRKAAKSLQQKALSEGYVLPLWREFPFVAYVSSNVEGPRSNGYAKSDAWSVETWFKP